MKYLLSLFILMNTSFAEQYSNIVTVHPIVMLKYSAQGMPILSLGYERKWNEKMSIQGNLTLGKGRVRTTACETTPDTSLSGSGFGL